MSVQVPSVRFKAGSVESELRLALRDLDTAWPARAKKRLERLYADLVAEAERAVSADRAERGATTGGEDRSLAFSLPPRSRA